jgi:general secretion pathway protein F/type IV pilus assembly protein PilC
MPLFAYQALNVQGKKIKGTLEAENSREAKEKLREQGLMVSMLSASSGISRKQNLHGDSLVTFTMQLGQLISGGIPLYESLIALEDQFRSEPGHRVVLSICEQIKRGKSLSAAMADFPGSFDQQYRAMIISGESVGDLSACLTRLSELLKKQSALQKKLVTSAIYPVILMSFSLLILSLLVGFVVPSIEGVFEGRELNTLTNIVIGTSHFFRDWWWIVIPLIMAAIAAAIYQFKTPAGQLWRQKMALKIPLIKTLTVQAAVARFSRTMGTLQEGGVPMIESIRIGREVMHNYILEEEMLRAEKRIIEGSSLSKELSRSHYMPKLVIKMVAVGEETGNMGAMLHRSADFYESELEKNLDRMMALSQPAILLLMGALIGLILMAVFLPLTDMQSFTQ